MVKCPTCGSNNIYGRYIADTFEGDWDIEWEPVNSLMSLDLKYYDIFECKDCENQWENEEV